VAYVRTRPEGSRTLLFENRKLVRILKIARVQPQAVVVEAFDPNEAPVFTLEAWQGNPIVVWSETQLAYYRLTRGRTPHAKLGFTAPLSIIILEEERCPDHTLSDDYVVRPRPAVRGRFHRRASR